MPFCLLSARHISISFRQKLGRGKVSKMPKNELVGVRWQDPNLCVRELEVENNFQQSQRAATGLTLKCVRQLRSLTCANRQSVFAIGMLLGPLRAIKMNRGNL